jgi:hypothetical protein
MSLLVYPRLRHCGNPRGFRADPLERFHAFSNRRDKEGFVVDIRETRFDFEGAASDLVRPCARICARVAGLFSSIPLPKEAKAPTELFTFRQLAWAHFHCYPLRRSFLIRNILADL